MFPNVLPSTGPFPIPNPKIFVTALMTGGERGYVQNLGETILIGVSERDATNFCSFRDAADFIKKWGLTEGNVVAT